jgi:hypothetical protein
MLFCSLSFSSLLLVPTSNSNCLFLLIFPTSCFNCLFQVLPPIPFSPCSLLLLDPTTRSCSMLILLVSKTCSFCSIYRLFLLLVPSSCCYCWLLLTAPTSCYYFLFQCMVLTAFSTVAPTACSTSFYFAIISFYTFPFKSMPSKPLFKFQVFFMVAGSTLSAPNSKVVATSTTASNSPPKGKQKFPHFEL